MSTKMKVFRCAVAMVFSVAISYPFRTAAKTQAPVNEQGPQTALQPGTARTGLIAGRGLKGRKILPPDTASARPKANISKAPVSPQAESFGGADIHTGSGAIGEVEPNDQVAQNVFMPVNIGGEMRFNGDQDVYAFPALANQQVTVDAFAGRIGSAMTAVIFLFDSTGTVLLGEAEEDAFGDDPFIQYVPPSRTTLIAVITDAFGFSGSGIFYILNIEAGVDVSPNVAPTVTPDTVATDVSVFGNMTEANEVDQYTFNGNQGETLIAACEASIYGGPLVSQLQLIDPTTNVVYFTNDHTDGDDPRFNIVLPYTGEFLITVSALSGGGEYDLNLTTVPQGISPVAPTITNAVHTTKGLIQVTGTGFSGKSIVEANSLGRPTSKIKKGLLQGHVKSGTGTVITVANKPDGERSNPFILP